MNFDHTLSQYQRILLDTDGTVTDLIRHFSGEEIHVTKLSQEIQTEIELPALELARPSSLLHRRILLSGSKRHYLYAESFFVMERMSDYLRKELVESEVPIGLLWQREKLETFREILEKRCEKDENLVSYFPNIESSLFLTRTYLIYHQGKPLGQITEKFPLEYFDGRD